jgi:hypothetical protein
VKKIILILDDARTQGLGLLEEEEVRKEAGLTKEQMDRAVSFLESQGLCGATPRGDGGCWISHRIPLDAAAEAIRKEQEEAAEAIRREQEEAAKPPDRVARFEEWARRKPLIAWFIIVVTVGLAIRGVIATIIEDVLRLWAWIFGLYQ